ncbi:pyridoxamine kinase [Oscillospiraceae bacterium PP1C4]
MSVPKVAAIHDLSGLGRCSLTAAIPILSAMGMQACPLPTAVLSNQTGFSSYTCVDMSRYIEKFVGEWKRLGVQFNGIYSGFLCNEQQVGQVAHLIDDLRGQSTVVVVDPVLGDSGELYPVFHPHMCDAMQTLIAKADIITPNLTEACILTGRDYAVVAADNDPECIWKIAEQLSEMGPKNVVITGIPIGAYIYNFGYSKLEHKQFSVKTRRMGTSYSGTGDILASILCGGVVRGDSLESALETAAKLLENAIADTYAEATDPNEGIAFENYLHLLIRKDGYIL